MASPASDSGAMGNAVKATIMLAVLAGLLPLAAPAETFRCGKWIINEDTTPHRADTEVR